MFSFVHELKRINNSPHLSNKEKADQVAEIKLPTPLAFVSKHFTVLIVCLMWGLPTIVALKLFSWGNQMQGPMQYLVFGMVPIAFTVAFVLTGGFFAQMGKSGIIEGKFPRSPSHPIYALRRIYGTAWTQVYYFKPLYSMCLAVPPLKKLLLRIYGYKGDMSVVVYPDSWVRDLPLLEVGKNVYIANRCVIGTNLCLNDNSIMVGKCTFDDNSMVGHLAIFGLGCKIGKKSELGVNAALGIRVLIKDNVVIAPRAEVNHATELGNGSKIGTSAVVGMKCKIGDGVEIKPGASIPPGSIILTQDDADKYYSSETQNLTGQKDTLFKLLQEQMKHGSSFKTGS